MPARAQIATEEYQLPHNAATDIPNHSRRRNGSSESLTEREALRSGWSAVRNRSSFLVGAKVFELRFRIEPVVNATERYVDRDGPRPVVVQSSRNGKAFKNTPADEFLTEMGHVEIPGFHADGDGTIDGRHRRLAVSAWMIPESDVPKLRQRHVVRDETNVRRHPRLTVDFGPHVLFDLVVYLLAIGHVDDRFGFSTPLVDDVHGFFVLRFAHFYCNPFHADTGGTDADNQKKPRRRTMPRGADRDHWTPQGQTKKRTNDRKYQLEHYVPVDIPNRRWAGE